MALEKIGATCLKTGNNGKQFMSGQIEIGCEKIPILIFRNRDKGDNPQRPDYQIMTPVEDDKGPSREEMRREKEATGNGDFEDIPF